MLILSKKKPVYYENCVFPSYVQRLLEGVHQTKIFKTFGDYDHIRFLVLSLDIQITVIWSSSRRLLLSTNPEAVITKEEAE